MKQTSRVGRQLLRAAIILSLLSLGACKIVSIEELKQQESQGLVFNSDLYIDKIWKNKILPYFENKPFPISDVVSMNLKQPDLVGKKFGYRESTEGSQWVYLVSGEATVLTKNTKSRAGKLVVQLNDLPDYPPITLQIGPVVKGNDVRDALPFIKFKDFSNQLEFADVGKSIKIKVINRFLPVVKNLTDGSDIRFVGVFKFKKSSNQILLTPVFLEVR